MRWVAHAAGGSIRVLVAALALSWLAGCGGERQASTPGQAATSRLTFVVRAPEAAESRAIPAATQSVEAFISAEDGWHTTAAVSVSPQQSTASLTVTGVPVGPVHVHFGAFDGPVKQFPNGSTAGTGNMLASAMRDVEVAATGNTVVSANFSATPTRIVVIVPNNGLPVVNVGGTLQWAAYPADADGWVLHDPAFTCTWSVQEPAGGSIDAAGLYTAPTVRGLYHVVATSGSLTGSAEANVQGGSGTGTVN